MPISFLTLAFFNFVFCVHDNRGCAFIGFYDIYFCFSLDLLRLCVRLCKVVFRFCECGFRKIKFDFVKIAFKGYSYGLCNPGCVTGGFQLDLTWKGCSSFLSFANINWNRIRLSNSLKSCISWRLSFSFEFGVGTNFSPLDNRLIC